MGRWVGVICIVVGFAGVNACATKAACDKETVDHAVAFLDAHQSCETDADCVIVSDYCGALPAGFCGQLIMSRDGAESAEWKSLDNELRDCGPSECTECLAAVLPACSDGSCHGPGWLQSE